MKRYERTKILVEGNPAVARKIAAQIEQEHSVEVLDEPHEELVMVKVRESAKNSLFYLGEALMCSCRVCLDDKAVGFGFALGDKREKAYNLALVDEAYSSDQIIPKTTWDVLIDKESERLRLKQQKEQIKIDRTKVDFSVMDSDD